MDEGGGSCTKTSQRLVQYVSQRIHSPPDLEGGVHLCRLCRPANENFHTCVLMSGPVSIWESMSGYLL